MKTRLTIFTLALLLLPPAGVWLADGTFDAAGAPTADGALAAATAASALLVWLLLCGWTVTLSSGGNPFRLQRDYFLALGAASAVLGWLLVHLNGYAASWAGTASAGLMDMAFRTLAYALFAPAVLTTRALLGAFPSLLHLLARGPALPAVPSHVAVLPLLALALLGLTGGAARPEMFAWLFWSAPLLLMLALQLLWHESTVFSGLKHGDWGRVACTALAGILVGNIAVTVYQLAGGTFAWLPAPLALQSGYALSGLLCMQLGDLLAEGWRGKRVASRRKKFPIPVVTRKP